MLKISDENWKKYINAMARISEEAAQRMQELMDKGITTGNMLAIMGQAHRYASVYGEAASALACELYDDIAVAQDANVPPAEPARPVSFQEVKDTVNFAMRRAPSTIPAETGKLVKKQATRTMRKNAARDGAFMALIPSGDGCAFCKMLASRGWESARASKSFEAHLHAHCRCEYVVRFNGDLSVEGYDPDALYDEFMSLEGSTWEERMNSMRREHYAEKKDEINAQKRAAYARRNSHSMKRNTSTSWKGEPQDHTDAEIEKLKKYASDKGLVLDPGFSSFDGDLELIKDFISTTHDNIRDIEFERNKRIRIGVSYTMSDDTYAETNNATITLNGFAFRERALLEADYNDRVNAGFFTKGSTYLDIATHESAHVIVYLNSHKKNGLFERVFGADMTKARPLIEKQVSRYALKDNDELIAESYVKYRNGEINRYVLKVLEFCDML